MIRQLFLIEWSLAPSCGNVVTLLCFCESASATEPDFKSKDWVFLNYTYKRFEGLTQRGTIPTYMKAGKAWRLFFFFFFTLRTQGWALEPPRWRLCLRPQHKCSTHYRLFRYAQPLQELSRAQKLPHYLCCFCSAIALRPGNRWGQVNRAVGRGSF